MRDIDLGGGEGITETRFKLPDYELIYGGDDYS